MKRFFPLVLLLATLATLSVLPASAAKDMDTVTLNVYNWGQYISDGEDDSLDVNAAFEDYFNENLAEEYGYYIEVNYSTYPSNEDMYNKLVSGSAQFDVITPSDYMIERMIAEGRLLPLDFEKIPSIVNIDEKFLSEYNTYDPENRYSVPYTFSMVGIIYNTKYVDEEDIGSWDLLWNEKYSGKILQFNNSRDAFGTALYYLGYSVNTEDHTKWTAALDLLKRQKPLVKAYVMDEVFQTMSSESAYIAPYYSGDYFTMYCDNEDLAFYYPREGTNFFVDAMCIPSTAKNVDAAHAYIDFMLQEEAAVANAMYLGYGCPNTVVRENEEYIEYMNDWHEDAMEILYGQEVTLDDYTDLGDIKTDGIKASFYRAVSNTEENGNLLDFTNDLWSKLKSESSIEAWIIVADAAIVGGLLAWLIFSVFRRRRRNREY